VIETIFYEQNDPMVTFVCCIWPSQVAPERSPLHIASWAGHAGACTALIEAGAHIDDFSSVSYNFLNYLAIETTPLRCHRTQLDFSDPVSADCSQETQPYRFQSMRGIMR